MLVVEKSLLVGLDLSGEKSESDVGMTVGGKVVASLVLSANVDGSLVLSADVEGESGGIRVGNAVGEIDAEDSLVSLTG